MQSTPTTAGGILIPPVLSARIAQLARNAMAVQRAGCAFVPMTSATLVMARQTADVSAGWYAANASISEADATFDSVTFTARKMATLVRVENELLEDASNIDSVIQASIAAAIALEFDRVALIGTGTAPQPRGVYNTSGINTVAAVGTPSSFDKFVQSLYQVRGANFEPTGALYSTRTAQTLAQLKNSIGDVLHPPAEWAALPKFATNQIINNQGTNSDESYAVIGQFDQLAVGLRHGIQIEVSREASDVFPKDQTMIRATWRGDIQVLQPKAFSLMTGIKA
jgi:HK97 family phage major capsid protein